MEFTMEDDMFASMEADIAAEYEDPEVLARIPEMELSEVTTRIRKLSNELIELGELQLNEEEIQLGHTTPIKTVRGLELHQLWVSLKSRQHDLMEEWPDDPEVPQAPA